ncbi:MAG: hypothetical protein ACTTIC_06540 [Helicobacteraceae bacterium]
MQDPLQDPLNEAVSSSSGGKGVLAPKGAVQDAVQIPEFYWQNRVTLMNVNSQKQFFYWELTEDFLKERLSRVDDEFTVRVILDSVQIDSFKIKGRNGSYYTRYQKSFGNLSLKILSFDNVELLTSSELILPSFQMHTPDKEVWMTKKRGEIITKKYSGVLPFNGAHLGSSAFSSAANFPQESVKINDLVQSALAQNLSSSSLGGLQ